MTFIFILWYLVRHYMPTDGSLRLHTSSRGRLKT